jgi:hypothetical protein
MKRTFKSFLPKGWARWKMFDDYGILDTCKDMNTLYKKDAQQFFEKEIKKIKITIEEI